MPNFIDHCGVAVDSQGNFYVADSWNHRIQKFDAAGNLLLVWGSHGSGDGQFQVPYGVAVDANGQIYVADANNNRIQKFDANGTWLATWGSRRRGHFSCPNGVAVDAQGNVYVADTFNNRIQKFDANGEYINQLGGLAPAPGSSSGRCGRQPGERLRG